MYVTNTATPDWKPLEDALDLSAKLDGNLAKGLTRDIFKYLGITEDDIRIYQHRDTRRNIYVDTNGKFYAYKPAYRLPGDYVYVEITREQALKAVRP